MANWVSAEHWGLAQDIDENSSTQKLNLGTRARCKDNSSDLIDGLGYGEFIYLKGVASTTVGDLVVFDENFATTLADANEKGIAAVAMSACVANEYGWYQISGTAIVNVAASFAAGNAVYLTSTAGTVDDAVVAGDLVHGAISQSAIDTPATGQAYIAIQYPYVQDV